MMDDDEIFTRKLLTLNALLSAMIFSTEMPGSKREEILKLSVMMEYFITSRYYHDEVVEIFESLISQIEEAYKEQIDIKIEDMKKNRKFFGETVITKDE